MKAKDDVVLVNAALTRQERAAVRHRAADLDRPQQEVVGDLVRRGLAAVQAEATGGDRASHNDEGGR